MSKLDMDISYIFILVANLSFLMLHMGTFRCHLCLDQLVSSLKLIIKCILDAHRMRCSVLFAGHQANFCIDFLIIDDGVRDIICKNKIMWLISKYYGEGEKQQNSACLGLDRKHLFTIIANCNETLESNAKGCTADD